MAMGGTVADAMDGPGLEVVEDADPAPAAKPARKAPPKEALAAAARLCRGAVGFGQSGLRPLGCGQQPWQRRRRPIRMRMSRN